MRIIVDNNILFSLMKPDSTSSFLFESMKVGFIAPSFIIKEFKKYRGECMKKSGLGEIDFKKREKHVFGRVKIIELEEYRSKLGEARKVSPDPDDSLYFALALKLNLPIWSNDVLLKDQDKVRVLSTEEIVKLMF